MAIYGNQYYSLHQSTTLKILWLMWSDTWDSYLSYYGLAAGILDNLNLVE